MQDDISRTTAKLVRICRKLRLPLPRFDHSMRRPWLETVHLDQKQQKIMDKALRRSVRIIDNG